MRRRVWRTHSLWRVQLGWWVYSQNTFHKCISRGFDALGVFLKHNLFFTLAICGFKHFSKFSWVLDLCLPSLFWIVFHCVSLCLLTQFCAFQPSLKKFTILNPSTATETDWFFAKTNDIIKTAPLKHLGAIFVAFFSPCYATIRLHLTSRRNETCMDSCVHCTCSYFLETLPDFMETSCQNSVVMDVFVVSNPLLQSIDAFSAENVFEMPNFDLGAFFLYL